MPPAFQSFMALQQPPWLPHGRHSVPDGQARSTRTGERNCSRMPTHQTRILHLCHSFLPHIQTRSPCISHSVCYRLRTQAISGPVERPGEGAEARTRLRQQLVSRRTLASIHSWPAITCAAVCGVSVVCMWVWQMVI